MDALPENNIEEVNSEGDSGEETDVDGGHISEPSDDDEESIPLDESLPKLPNLISSSGGAGGGPVAQSGPVAEIAVESEASLDADDPLSGSLIIDPFNMFEGTEFVLATELPQSPNGMLVVKRTRSSMTAELAREIANRFGFTGTIYQEQLPIQFMDGKKM